MLEKNLECQGCGQQLKSYIHTPKPQIQSAEPRRRRLGIRTIPCIFGDKGRIKRLKYVFCVCVCVYVCVCFFFFFFLFYVFGKKKKSSKFIQVEHRTQGVSFFGLEGGWGLLQPRHALRGISPYRAATFKWSQMGLILTHLK